MKIFKRIALALVAALVLAVPSHALLKNTAGQIVTVQAIDKTTALPVTGDAANITATISLDGDTTPPATNDVNPVETNAGQYVFDLTQAETDADKVDLAVVSSTGDVVISPVFIYTTEAMRGTDSALLAASAPTNFGDMAITVTTGEVAADVVEISGDSTAANNLELQYDTTGLAGDTFPASQAQVGQIGTGSASISKVVAGGAGTGVETLTYTATQQLDGMTNDIAPSGGVVSWVYEFQLGPGNTASVIDWDGYVNTNSDTLTIEAYDWVGAGYTGIGLVSGSPGSTIAPESWVLDTRHTGTGANAGIVRIQFSSSGAPVITNVSTDRILCGYAVTSLSVGYANGAIWTDTNNGTAGIVAFFNGTADNPVDSLADTIALLSSVGLSRVELIDGSAITFGESHTGESWRGDGWTLALGGQDISDSQIRGANVTGISTGTGAEFHHSLIGTSSLDEHNLFFSGIAGDISLLGAGTYYWDQCYSGVAGTATPSVDYGVAVGSTNLNLRHYSGGIEVENMGQAGTDNMSLEGWGQLVVNANCTGGTIAVRGNFKITDNSAGAVTIDRSATFTQSSWIDEGTAQAATSVTITLAASAPSSASALDPSVITITGGTGEGQSRPIIEYNGTTKIAVVRFDFKTIPDGTSTYRIESSSGGLAVNQGLAQAGAANTITLNALASSVNDTYKDQIVYLTGGVGADQSGQVASYDGATQIATMREAWVTQPTSGTVYEVLPIDVGTTEVAAGVASILEDTGTTLPAQIDALNDLSAADVGAIVIDGTVTLQQALTALLAFTSGETTGGGTTTLSFKRQDDTTSAIIMTVDTNGNRSAVTLDLN